MMEMRHTSLGCCDDISTLKNSRNCVCLDGSGVIVAAKIDIADHDRVQASSVELGMSGRISNMRKGRLTSEMGSGRSSASATTWI